MKQFLLILAAVVLAGCGKKAEPPKAAAEKLITDPIIEKAVREQAGKPTGELTEADLEKAVLLNLDNNQLTDIEELEKLTQLMFLSLGTNILTDVKGLEKLAQLIELNLSSNQLTDVPKELENLKLLKSLSLSKNQLTNIKGLEKLINLQLLSLGGNQLTNINGLGMLSNLGILRLQNNPDLTKAQIDELQKALPNCKILSNPTK